VGSESENPPQFRDGDGLIPSRTTYLVFSFTLGSISFFIQRCKPACLKNATVYCGENLMISCPPQKDDLSTLLADRSEHLP
jgi:hypothetical protein